MEVKITCNVAETQRGSKQSHSVGKVCAATVNRRVASSNLARGANFLFLGMVQIAGHQDVRCERLESKEFVFLFHFSVFQRPVVGARMLCTGFARSTNRGDSAVSPGRTWFVDLRGFSCRPGSLGLLALSPKSGAVGKGPHEPTNSMSYK